MLLKLNKPAFVASCCCLALAAVLSPDVAHAGGIAEFANPVQQVLNTLRGPVGKALAAFMIGVCAIGYWFTRGEEISGIWKSLMGVVFVITLLALCVPIVEKLFTFSGAIL